jgi:hypothetical protein
MTGNAIRPLGYDALCALAKELDRPQSTLIVLSHGADPFGCGTPAQVAHAEWFVALWRQHMPRRGGHLRRLHYRLVSTTGIMLPDGQPYENTITCWARLKNAGKWARNLRLIDAGEIDDRRSPSPHLFQWNAPANRQPTIEVTEPETFFLTTLSLRPPELPDPPQLTVRDLSTGSWARQRYHVEIWVEKSDVEDVVLPIAQSYGVNYCPFIGQAGQKPCRELVERALASGKPVRILYISDFDPQGESMPVAVARKIEHELAVRELDLDIQVIPLALTRQQCIDLKLPRIPIKDSDRGKGRFEERHGEGATELDALEALHPGQLRQLILTELRRYYDDTLGDRAKAEFYERLQALSSHVKAVNDVVIPRFEDDLRQLSADRDEIIDALRPIEAALAPIRQKALAFASASRPSTDR